MGAAASDDLAVEDIYVLLDSRFARSGPDEVRRLSYVRSAVRNEHVVGVGPTIHGCRQAHRRSDVIVLGELRDERRSERHRAARLASRNRAAHADHAYRGRHSGRRRVTRLYALSAFFM